MKRKLKIFTYGFYIGMVLWMCGLVASMIVNNVTMKMLLIFIPLALWEDGKLYFTLEEAESNERNKKNEV